MHVVLKDQKEALALLQSAMNKVWVTHRLQVARLNGLGKRHMDTVTRENQFILAKNLCDVEVLLRTAFPYQRFVVGHRTYQGTSRSKTQKSCPDQQGANSVNMRFQQLDDILGQQRRAAVCNCKKL